MKLELNKNIVYLDEIESTNSYAIELIKDDSCRNAFVISADFQSAGKGQRLSSWMSDKYKNILLSIVIKSPVNISYPFYLTALSSLCLIDLLEYIGIDDISIKWPNDILVDNKKIAGILIENKMRSNKILNTVIGIGLNVNQSKFPNFDREATSIINEKFIYSDIDHVLHKLLFFFERRYSHNILSQEKNVICEYINHLYLRDTTSLFEINGREMSAKIMSVTGDGRLIVDIDNEIHKLLLGQVKFLS